MDISRETFIEMLIMHFEKLDINLTENQQSQFYDYYRFLVEKNSVMNLTAITEPEDVIVKHFVDSVSLCKFYDMDKVKSCIDVGTGAGFPGIPLKIIYPDIEFTLLDSLNKRINFLNETIDLLKLDKITAVHFRAEDGARDKSLREKFDLCVSRAVANLSVLSEYCVPFVRVGGSFVSYKSGKVSEEVTEANNAIKILGGANPVTQDFVLPDTDYSRSFVIIEKVKNTGNKYPRKAGTPKNQPL